MNTRIGCLGLLALWAAWGLYLHFTGGFGEEGGGLFALMGILGLAVVIIGRGIERLTMRRPRESRGRRVERKRPDGEA